MPPMVYYPRMGGKITNGSEKMKNDENGMDYIERRFNACRIDDDENMIQLGKETTAWVIRGAFAGDFEMHLFCNLPDELKLDWGIDGIDMCLSIWINDDMGSWHVGDEANTDDDGNVIVIEMPNAERVGEYISFNGVWYVNYDLRTISSVCGVC